MKKTLLPVLLFTVLLMHSQNNTGIVHYGEIQSMGMGGPVGADYNALLVFNNNHALYITRQDSLEGGHIREQKTFGHGNGNRSSITVATNEPGFRYYNDLKGKKFYSRDIGFRYVKETTPKIPWKITSESKLIGEHLTHKATAEFRGRNYTAWFTTDIPLPYGPWKLQGLPGLILEAYDTHKEIYWYFKELEVPTDQGYLLKPIDNKKPWISHEQYAKDLFEGWKNAQMGGRMAAESIGASGQQDHSSGMLRSYIEDFAGEEESN